METKEILSFIDIGEVKTIDELKEKFKTRFISREEVFDDEEVKKKIGEENNKFVGKLSGSLITRSKRDFGLTDEDIKDKKIEEVLALGVARLKAENEELRSKGGQGNDKALEKALADIDKTKKMLQEEKEAKEGLQSIYEKEKGEWEGNLKNFKLNTVKESKKSSIATKFKSDMTKAEQIAWETETSAMILDYDDKGDHYVKDKEGKRLPNPNKAGGFLSLEEALELKANELNLIKKNNGSGSAGLNMFGGNSQQQNQVVDPNLPVRKIHPSALAHAEKLATRK
jgi:hypothetical protein